MANNYLTTAFHTRIGNPTTKLILVRLADLANGNGICWPSHKEISDAAEVSERTVQRHIKALADLGIITIKNRFIDGTQTSNSYTLNKEKMMALAYDFEGVVTVSGGGDKPDINREVGVTLVSGGGCHRCHTEPSFKPSLKEKNTKKESFSKNTASVGKNSDDNPCKKDAPKIVAAGKQKTKNKKFDPVGFRPAEISAEDWQDLLEHRKHKKAKNTPRSLSALVKEFTLARQYGYTPTACIEEMILRNWTGFRAAWIAKNEQNQPMVTATREKQPVFWCVECASSQPGGPCKANKEDRACPNFSHRAKGVNELWHNQPDKGILQGSSPVVPAAILSEVNRWRSEHRELWS